MKSIEHVEVDLEPVLVPLEWSLMRNRLGFSVFFGWFGWFWVILGVKMGTKVDFFLIGIDRARRAWSGISVGIIWNGTQANRPRFFSDFWVIWVVLGDFMGEDGDLYEIWGLESIELVEFYLESRWNHLEWYTGESAQVFLKIARFLDLFLQFFGVFGGKEGYFWKVFFSNR